MRQAKVMPYVTAKKSNSAIDGRTIRYAGYAASLKGASWSRNLGLGEDHWWPAQDPVHWVGEQLQQPLLPNFLGLPKGQK